MIKKFLLVFSIFSLLLGLFSCTKKDDDKLKVLNLVVAAKVKGMDPIYSNDRYSSNEVARVYEGLLEYHYLKRPFQLIPNLAESMPKVSENGLVYTFKIKKGVLFHDNKCFKDGKGRELVAEDFVYTIKRLADPKLKSLGWWLLDGKIKGLNEWRKKFAELPKVDYSEEVAGVKALDRYTLRFELAKPFPQFLYALAMTFTFATPKEAVEFYGKEFLNHPVGTGPFMLDKFTQSNKIVYHKNPKFRDKFYPTEASEEFKKKGFLADAGKKLPLVDKVIVHIITEDQPRWLNFQKGKVDYLSIPKDNFDTAITPSKGLSDDLKKKDVGLQIVPLMDITYVAFNHDLDLFKNNRNLRCALSLAFDVYSTNKLFYSSNALPAQSVVPPGIAGYEKDFKNSFRGPDIKQAKELLAKAGYPGGKGLPQIVYDSSSSSVSRQMGEHFKKSMAKIGVKIKVQTNPWPQLQKKIQTRSIQMWGIAWGADYPDAENFLQLLYGPNRSPGANGSGYDNPEFNKLFEKSAIMQDGPERTALYQKLNRMAANECPWIFGVHRQSYVLTHSWFRNFIYSNFEYGRVQYLNIDLKKKKEMLKNL